MASSIVSSALILSVLVQLLQGSEAARLFTRSCINCYCSAIRVSLSNPPVHLWDYNVIHEFNTLMGELSGQNDTKVVVFNSDNPDFWAAQLDANLFIPGAIPGVNGSEVLEMYAANLDLLLTTNTIFIGEVNG